MITEIIVVGGGPCGSYTGLTASKQNAKVIICEEHPEIGAPRHCAGHISLSGLKRLSLELPQKSIENEIRGAHFYSQSGEELTIRTKKTVTYIINRELLDKYLAELAAKAGAEYLMGTKVRSFITNGDKVEGVIVEREGKTETLRSKIVVDAEGAAATLLRRAHLPVSDRSQMVNSIQIDAENIELEDEDMVEVYLTQKYAHGLFAWIIPKQKGKVRIGLASKTGNVLENLKEFANNHPVASKKLKKIQITNPSFHLIPLGGIMPKTYHEGLLVVGDAASQVKPTTGGGVIFGLTCAKIAGEIAAKAIASNDQAEGTLSEYQSKCKEAVGFDLTAMRMIRRKLDNMSDEKIERAFKIWRRFDVPEALERVGDLDYQGRSLLKVAKSPKALLGVTYSFLTTLLS